MSAAGPPSKRHLARAEQTAHESDLLHRAVEALAAALARRYPSASRSDRPSYLQQQQALNRSDDALRRFFDRLSADWPDELRIFLLANWRRFVPRRQQQQQQQRQQQQQQQQQQQEQIDPDLEIARFIAAGIDQQSADARAQRERTRSDLAALQRAALKIQAPTVSRGRPLAPPVSRGPPLAPPHIDVPQASPMTEGAEPPEAATPDRPAEDRVSFAAWGPPAVTPGEPFVLDLWAYADPQSAKVRQLAQRLGQIEAGDRDQALVARGALLTVRLDCPMLTIEQDVQPLPWGGSETVASFNVVLPQDGNQAGRLWSVSGRFEVRAGGLTIAQVPFRTSIGKPAAGQRLQPMPLSNPTPAPRTAFASYSSEDRIDVLRCIDGLKKGLPDIDVFLDFDKLRSGDDWQEKLVAYIRTSDIFYLFWSTAASRSPWVEREWRQAYQERGIEFIDPFPLENPKLAPPPKELEQLHFNSVYVNHINAERYVRGQLAARAEKPQA